MRLHLVDGPLATESHPTVLKGKFPMYGSTMTVTLPDGEVCSGRLKSVEWRTTRDKDTPGIVTDLAPTWIAVWGPPFNPLPPYFRATLKGNRGTILRVETMLYTKGESYHHYNAPTNIYGVGVDNKGDTYKIE